MVHILVVEDEELVRSLLRLALEGFGYDVLEARNGLEGLAVCRQTDVGLVITDLEMPEMDGVAMIKTLRCEQAHMPIIAISGWKPGQRADYLEVARVAGADAVLRKPFTIDELLAQVQDVASARISMQQVPRAG